MPISNDFTTHIDVLYNDFKKNQNSWFWWFFFPRKLASTLESYHAAQDESSKIQASIQLCEIYFSLWSITKWFFKILECFKRSFAVLALMKMQQAQLLDLQTKEGQTIYTTVLTSDHPLLFLDSLTHLKKANLLDSENCIDTLNHPNPFNAASALGLLQKHELLSTENRQRILSHPQLPEMIASLLLLEQNQLLDGPMAQSNFENILDSKCNLLNKFIALHGIATPFSQEQFLQLTLDLNCYTASYQNLFDATRILSQLGQLNMENWQAVLKSKTAELIEIIKHCDRLDYPKPIEFKAIIEILSQTPGMSQDNFHTIIIALLDDPSPRFINHIYSILRQLDAINLLNAKNFRILVRHPDYEEIDNALNFLQNTAVLDSSDSQKLFELIFKHKHPYPLIVCLNTLEQAKIFNTQNIVRVFNNPRIYEFTNAINVLINSGVLNQDTFNFLDDYSHILLFNTNWLLWTKIPNRQFTERALVSLTEICSSPILSTPEKITAVADFLTNFLTKAPTLGDDLIDEAIAFFYKEYLKDMSDEQLGQLIEDLSIRINLSNFNQFTTLAYQETQNIGGLSLLHLLAISELLIKQSEPIILALLQELSEIESKLSQDNIAENTKMSFESLLTFLVKQQHQLQVSYQTHDHNMSPTSGGSLSGISFWENRVWERKPDSRPTSPAP